MIKKLIKFTLIFQAFTLYCPADHYVLIESGSDSDTEEVGSLPELKTVADVDVLRSLAPNLLIDQAEKLLHPIALQPIHVAPIATDKDGAYLLGAALFQDAKFYLQSKYDLLARSLGTLASGKIFDDLFNLRFDSKQAAFLYVDWLKKSYKYALVQVLSQKFQKTESLIAKEFEAFKDKQKAEVADMMRGLQRQYPRLQSYCKHLISSAGIVAACSYGKRVSGQASMKKYFHLISVPVALGVVGYNVRALYAHYSKVKALDATKNDLSAILTHIDRESLQINTQAYDQMIAKFMKNFDMRSDRFLQHEAQRLGAVIPEQPVMQKALVVGDKEATSYTWQKVALFLKKIAHS